MHGSARTDLCGGIGQSISLPLPVEPARRPSLAANTHEGAQSRIGGHLPAVVSGVSPDASVRSRVRCEPACPRKFTLSFKPSGPSRYPIMLYPRSKGGRVGLAIGGAVPATG